MATWVKRPERIVVAYSGGGIDAFGYTVTRIHYSDGTVDEHRSKVPPRTLVIIPRPGV